MRRIWLVGLALALLAATPVLIPPSFGLTDHLIFWKAGQLAVSGASPYDAAAWADAQQQYASGQLLQFIQHGDPVWVYPAWSVLLFIPFGLLPYPLGPWVLDLGYIVVGILAAILFVRLLPERWRAQAQPAIPLVAVSEPYLIAARDGQFGSFLLLGAVLVFMGLRERRARWLVCGSLVLFAKPQLFLGLVVAVLMVLVLARAWRTIMITAVALAAVAIVTTARWPESLTWFSRAATDRVEAFTIYSTTWAFAHYVVPGAWIPVAIGLVAATTAATAIAIRRLPADLRLAGTVAGGCIVSLAIAPVDFHYDQLPLMLAVVLAAAVGRRRHLAAILLLGVVMPWGLFFAAAAIAVPDAQALSGAVPLLIASLLLLATEGGEVSVLDSTPTSASSPLRAKTAVKLK